MSIRNEEPRIKILKAAIELTAKFGFLNLSFQKIADKCRVSQSTVMHYFPNKFNLIKSMGDYITQTNVLILNQGLLPTDNAFDRLKKYFSSNIYWAKNYPEQAQIIILLSYFSGQDKEMAELYKARLEQARLRIAEIIYSGIRENKFNPSEDIDTLSALLHNIISSTIINLISSRDFRNNKNKKDSVKKWEIAIKLLLNCK